MYVSYKIQLLKYNIFHMVNGGNVMKRKLKSMIAMLLLALLLLQPGLVSAAEAVTTNEVTTSATPQISEWAYHDMVFAETYGIYPDSWLFDGFNQEITPARMRNLVSRLRHKILDTEAVVENDNPVTLVREELTVAEAIHVFYELMTSYDYPVDMGFEYGYSPIAFFQALGLYTGENGEQELEELITVEQAVIIGARMINIIYYQLDAASKGFFWEVTEGENKVYLLGSIHVAGNDIYPFSTDLWSAFHESDGLVVESNPYETAGIEGYKQIASYPEGETLADYITEETYQVVADVCTKLGIPMDQLETFKAWELYITFSYLISQYTNPEESASTGLGIDMTFVNQAILTQKPIYEIEGTMAQAEMLNSFSYDLQELLLYVTATQLGEVLSGNIPTEEENSVAAWYDMWKAGDVDGFKEANKSEGLDEELSEELEIEELKLLLDEYQLKFMTQRDEKMAAYIDSILQLEGKNTYFVVVGAAHYISEYSVIDMLEEMGYEVTQIK